METANLTLFLAFGGGVISFLSPCVLPLVPAYIGHLAGHTLDKEGGSRARTLAHAMAFVLGFTAVFVALGTTASLIGAVAQDVLKSMPFRIGSGVVLIILGLHMTGLLRINALYRDTRFQMKPNRRWGLASSFLIGLIFAAGWTPCIGPILGSILVVAAMQGTTGALLLAVYSLGLGVPFLVAGYALESATKVIRRLNRHARSVELIGGGSMVVMGLLVMFNITTLIAAWASSIGFVVG